MTATAKTGLGHQFKSDRKALQAGFNSMNEAFDHLLTVKEASQLRDKLITLMMECNEMITAADYAYEQND